MRHERCANRANLNKLSDFDLVLLIVDPEHEVRGIVRLENAQAASPITFCCVYNAGPWTAQVDRLVEVRDTADLLDRKSLPAFSSRGLTSYMVLLPDF